MTCGAAQSGTLPPVAPPRWAPCKCTYQGLFHGTVALHHAAILVNQELQRGGVRWRGPHRLPHLAGQPWSSTPFPRPPPTLVKFHLIALQEKGRVMRSPVATAARTVPGEPACPPRPATHFPSMPRPLGWIFIHFHSGWASSPLTQILLNKSNLTL